MLCATENREDALRIGGLLRCNAPRRAICSEASYDLHNLRKTNMGIELKTLTEDTCRQFERNFSAEDPLSDSTRRSSAVIGSVDAIIPPACHPSSFGLLGRPQCLNADLIEGTPTTAAIPGLADAAGSAHRLRGGRMRPPTPPLRWRRVRGRCMGYVAATWRWRSATNGNIWDLSNAPPRC
jgi:hypothetical protein